MQLLQQHIEALIFTAEQPIPADEIISCLKTVYGWDLTKKDIQEAVEQLKQKYVDEMFSFEVVEIAEGYQFLSKKEYHTAVNALLQLKARKRLSTAALETLAIIAYKQPLSKSEIEHIRGVNCDYSIQKLLEKELIVIEGKSDGPGKPLLYGTSRNFMEHFGLKSVKELPKLKDLHIADNEIGMPSDLTDDGEIPVDYAPGQGPENVADEGSLTDESGEMHEESGVSSATSAENGTLEQDLSSEDPSSENNT